MIFKFFSQVLLTALAKSLTALSKLVISDRLDILRFLMDIVMSLMKDASSFLFLMIECLVELTLSSTIGIVMIREVWSSMRHHSRYIKWLFNSFELLQRNMRSMTEFESFILLEYLVETWLVEIDKSKLKIITNRRMVRKRRIPLTIPYVEVTNHN